jgi:hypothetical protein
MSIQRYLFFLEEIVTMFQIVELRVELVVVFLILTKLEELSLKLGDNQILLVGFDLRRIKVLFGVKKFE